MHFSLIFTRLGQARWFAPIGLLGIAGCNRTETTASRADGAATAVPIEHSVTVSAPEHDFGRVTQGVVLRDSLTVHNGGQASVQVTTETSGQRCRGELERVTLAPGESAALAIRCATAAAPGPLREVVIVHTDGAPDADVGVHVSAEVMPALLFEPSFLSVEVPYGQHRTREIAMNGEHAADARWRVGHVDHAFIEATILHGNAGHGARLRVRVRGALVGYHAGKIVLHSDVAGISDSELPYACRVAGTLTVSPSTPYFNLREPGPKVRLIEVHDAQPSFSVREVRVLEGPFKAALDHTSAGGAARVLVTVADDGMRDEARGMNGRLLIVSNDLAEPHKEIPLFAFGRLNRSPADGSPDFGTSDAPSDAVTVSPLGNSDASALRYASPE